MRAMLVEVMSVPNRFKSRFAELSQKTRAFLLSGTSKWGLRFAEPDSDVASIGDFSCIFNGFGNVFEECCHVFRRTEARDRDDEGEAIFVGDFLLSRMHRRMSCRSLSSGVDIVHVVCRDERNARFENFG